jgi:hypothetical protein
MIYPSVKLHQLYSINISSDIDIVFEELTQINLEDLKNIVINKLYDVIQIIPEQLVINAKNNEITLKGYKLNNNTYILGIDKSGTEYKLKYSSNDDMITGIEYLYHMYKNLC